MKDWRAMAGFAARAGHVVAGEQGVLIAVERGKAALVLLAQDTARHTSETVGGICSRNNVPLRRLDDDDPGYYMGKSGRKVLAITDKHFAQVILELVDTDTDG